MILHYIKLFVRSAKKKRGGVLAKRKVLVRKYSVFLFATNRGVQRTLIGISLRRSGSFAMLFFRVVRHFCLMNELAAWSGFLRERKARSGGTKVDSVHRKKKGMIIPSQNATPRPDYVLRSVK